MIKHYISLDDIVIRFVHGGSIIINTNTAFTVEDKCSNIDDDDVEILLSNKSAVIMGSCYFKNNIVPKCKELTKDEVMIMDIIK